MATLHYPPSDRNKLPNAPGVYKFYNNEGKLIYVGKAKDLKKRVASYFTKASTSNRKTIRLSKEIDRIEFVIVNSEFDALLLENNLIKENQPRYNILLKDDKTFPYICIVRERFPRIISTRKFRPEYGEYFGPYSSVVAMNNVLDLVRKLHTIRTCKLLLSTANIKAEKFKVCLEYHIGNCLGPCEALQSSEDYEENVQLARNILKGNINIVKTHFKNNMADAAEALDFETAQLFKEKLALLDKFQAKSTVVNPKISNLDVFTIVTDDTTAYINYMFVKSGAINVSKTIEVKNKLEESPAEILSFVAFDIRSQYSNASKEVISNEDINLGENIQTNIPQRGDKHTLVKMSLKNALEFKKNKLNQKQEKSDNEILIQLQQDLRLTELPKHIECFDNSNIQGSSPVASMVCFMNGKPAKKEYRHYNVKTVTGPDDFASMNEIVTRRYKRLLAENKPLPHLIVIDGGKGQLSSACEALRSLHLYGKIPIIGIAKRLEEIYYPEDSIPLHINKKSPSLMLLQRIRDEAHRFAITFHRNKRSKKSINTELENIKGIGSGSINKLLQHFRSPKKIKAASLDELAKIIGRQKASIIKNHYQ